MVVPPFSSVSSQPQSCTRGGTGRFPRRREHRQILTALLLNRLTLAIFVFNQIALFCWLLNRLLLPFLTYCIRVHFGVNPLGRSLPRKEEPVSVSEAQRLSYHSTLGPSRTWIGGHKEEQAFWASSSSGWKRFSLSKPQVRCRANMAHIRYSGPVLAVPSR